MKKSPKFAVLMLIICSAFSFKASEASWNEKKVIQLEKKYHLKRLAGAIPANVRNFDTLEEFEAFLKTRNRRQTATAKASIKKNFRRIGSSASNSVYSDPSGGHEAILEFDDLLFYGYPELLKLMWQDNNLSVTSQLRTNSNTWYPFVQSWHYSQNSGSKGYNTMTIIGEYEENYSNGGSVWISTFDVEIDATFDPWGISATIYIEDRGW